MYLGCRLMHACVHMMPVQNPKKKRTTCTTYGGEEIHFEKRKEKKILNASETCQLTHMCGAK
jgi:hypothetical protein